MDEDDETFTLTLSSPANATLGDATATGTINDNDNAAPLTASFSDMRSRPTSATETVPRNTFGWLATVQDIPDPSQSCEHRFLRPYTQRLSLHRQVLTLRHKCRSRSLCPALP